MNAFSSTFLSMRQAIFALALLGVLLPMSSSAQQEGKVDARLAMLLKQFPQSDANGDGELTAEEALAFIRKRRGGSFKQNPTIFEPSEAEMQAAIDGGRALAFPRGEDGSLRLVMTGHSWVAPGIKTMPPLVEAAGYPGHRQHTHTGGGGTGSANAIWLKEFGKWKEDVPAAPKLLPAISTGEWDVMTWGPYYLDKPVYYTQWIDVCLKHNPQTIFFLQDAWPRFAPAYRKQANAAVATAIAEEHQMLQAEMFEPLYTEFASSYPGKMKVIPVSAALVDLMQQFAAGEIEHLTCIDEAKRDGEVGFYRDGGHLSRASGIEHLVGYAYFAMLYRRSPATVEGYSPRGVPAAFDKQMRQASWKAVVDSPFADIDDDDGDGYADSAATDAATAE